jgi:hypothetical protein
MFVLRHAKKACKSECMHSTPQARCLPASPPQCCLVQLLVMTKGMHAIRVLEGYSAPVLVALVCGLLWWAVRTAGGWGPMLAAPSQVLVGGLLRMRVGVMLFLACPRDVTSRFKKCKKKEMVNCSCLQFAPGMPKAGQFWAVFIPAVVRLHMDVGPGVPLTLTTFQLYELMHLIFL